MNRRKNLTVSNMLTKLTCWVLTTLLIFSLLFQFLLIPSNKAYAADDEYYGIFTAPNNAIRDEIWDKEDGMVSITTSDIESIEALSTWLSNQKSFITVREYNGTISYYFNTLNLQKSIANSVQRFNTGGWEFSRDSVDSLIESDSTKWTTALKKYGYNIPKAEYCGEYPAPQLDIGHIAEGVANPITAVTITFTGIANWVIDRANDAKNALNSVINFFGSLVGVEVTSGDIDHIEAQIAETTPDSIKGIHYNTSDYRDTTQDTDIAVAKWLQDNWQFMKEHRDTFEVSLNDSNGAKLFDDGVIVYEGETPGENLSGSTIYSRIINKVGLSYIFLINTWIDVAEKNYDIEGPRVSIYRHMPYDLSSMSDASKDYMHGVSDPRVEMFTNGGNASVIYLPNKTYRSMNFESNITEFMQPLATICSFAGMLNSICDLDFIKNGAGLDLFWLWKGSIGELILIIACLAFLIIIVRGALGFVTKSGAGITISKMITSAILSLILIGLIAMPDRAGDLISNVASKGMSYGTTMLDTDESYRDFYTDGATESDKTQLRYWMLYFNAYCNFATNNSFNSEAMKFDPSQGRNEYIEFDKSTATLANNDTINNWGAILLESGFNHSLDAYRVSDHVMAPIIKSTGYPEFTVEENNFYNGYMFSKAPGNALMISVAVLVFTMLKLVCFVELLIDMMLFLLKLSIGAIEGSSKMKDVIKHLLLDLLKVLVYELAITVSIFMSFNLATPGTASTIISFFLFVASLLVIRYLVRNPQNIFAPGLFTTVSNIKYRIVNSFGALKKASEERAKSIEQINAIDDELSGNGYDTMRKRRRDIKDSLNGIGKGGMGV